MNSTADETFKITHTGGLFRLTDGKGQELETGAKVKPLEKAAWSRGAQKLIHDYDLKLAES